MLGAREFLSVGGKRDRKIVAIADAQRGRVARRQLLAAGITKSQITHMISTGWLRPLHRGVYAVGHLAPIELGRETAALLAIGDGAVLSHLTAAAIWNLRPVPSDHPIEVTVPRSATGRRVGIVIHSSRDLTSRDVRIRCDLPVTSAARALLDIAPLLTHRELERALDEGLIQRVVRRQELYDLVARAKGRPGVVALKVLLDERHRPTLTRSEGEELFLALVKAANLPLPEVNVQLHGFTVDFLWRRHGVVVEIDGYRYHSTRSAFERDHRKDGVLTAAGLDVHRFTYDQTANEPVATIVRVSQALEAAKPRAA